MYYKTVFSHQVALGHNIGFSLEISMIQFVFLNQ